MFRAIKPYDGSDSTKCIDLHVGDNLSAVHALDDIWFIGYNDRTGKTGAFPIECVEDCQDGNDASETGTPLSIYLSIYLSTRPSVHLSIHPSIHPS